MIVKPEGAKTFRFSQGVLSRFRAKFALLFLSLAENLADFPQLCGNFSLRFRANPVTPSRKLHGNLSPCTQCWRRIFAEFAATKLESPKNFTELVLPVCPSVCLPKDYRANMFSCKYFSTRAMRNARFSQKLTSNTGSARRGGRSPAGRNRCARIRARSRT